MLLYQQLKNQYFMIWNHTMYHHDMISAWWVGYDARMVYYCNESIWYQDKIYQYHMIYQCDMIYQYDMARQQWYDISVWHDTTAVWCDILSQTCVIGIMTFRCLTLRSVGPSVLRCFFLVVCFLTRQWGHIEEIAATSDFEQQKEWDIVKGKFLLAFNSQCYDTF